MGRQSTYSFETSETICDRIADGEPLRVICRSDGMPAWRTVYGWLDSTPDFATRFAHARLLGFDMLAQEALEIADTPCHAHTVVTSERNGRTVTSEDALGHRKLQVWTRLQLLAKWDPKRYGDKLTTEVTGANGGAIQVDDSSTASRLAAILGAAKARRGNETPQDDLSDIL